MSKVYVFGPTEVDNDYSTMGLVGALTPTQCRFKEEANGDSIVTLVHPLDDLGRYKSLQKRNIIAVPVPVFTTPEIQNGSCVTTVWTYQVKPLNQLTSKNQRTLYSKKTGSTKKKVMPTGTVVTVVWQTEDSGVRWKAKTKYGTGWIDPNGFTLVTEYVIPDNSQAIQDIQSPWTITDQYFRIYEDKKTLTEITIKARHIRYDLLYNKTRYESKASVGLQTAITGILDNCYGSHNFTGYTNVLNTMSGLAYKMLNPIEAFLNPEKGICKKYNVGLVSDNYELYFLHDPGVNRGVRISYRHNMTGIEFVSSDENVATRIIPIGETKDGDDLMLSDTLSLQYVDSPNIGVYPVPHIYELRCENCKVGDKDENGSEITIAIARARMRQQALDLLDTGCDQPSVSMSVKFVNLGDTEEYRQFKNLDNAFLFDYLVVQHPDLDIDVTTQIVGFEWDVLADRMESVDIGSIRKNFATSPLTTWQIPSGFNGRKIEGGTIGGGALRSDVISARHIQAGSINAEAIQADAVTAVKIAADSIDANKIKANTITAAKMVAGTITAESGIIADAAITEAKIGVAAVVSAHIKDGSIENGHIKDATISSAKIVSLDADVIDAGTLSVEHLLIVGPNSVMYEINATSAGLTAAELTDEQYQSKMSGKVIVAQSITADKIDVFDLFAATATINSLKTMTVGSLLNGSVLELNELRAKFKTPEFLIQLAGAEEGHYAVLVNGLRAYFENAESPTLARRRPGGVYKVGSGQVYTDLADAFADFEGAVLDGDVVLKLGAHDSGGVLRGVRGGHRVIITSGQLLERTVFSANQAALEAYGSYGYKIVITTAGTYRYVKIMVGRVGDMGLAGKEISIGVGNITTSGGTAMLAVLRLYTPDGVTLKSDITSVYAPNTLRTGLIPADAEDDDLILLVLYSSQATSCAVGAYTLYDDLKVELGDSMFSWPTAKYNIANLEVEGCDEVDFARINLPTGAKIRNSNVVLSRSELYNTIFATMCRLVMHDNKGTCTQAVYAKAASVLVTGPAPGGTYDGWDVNTTDATIGSSGAPPATKTKTISANSTGTYSSSWWSSDRSVRQGYLKTSNRLRGGIWFNPANIPANATAMKLELNRIYGYGLSAGASLRAYGTVSNARDGQPALTTGPYDLGTSAAWGKTKSHDLPPELVTALAAGTIKGIVLYSADTTALSGEDYSQNYARFGGTDGTPPKLIITYPA